MNCIFQSAIKIYPVLGKLCTKPEDFQQNGMIHTKNTIKNISCINTNEVAGNVYKSVKNTFVMKFIHAHDKNNCKHIRSTFSQVNFPL
jgi:hypothetical protein